MAAPSTRRMVQVIPTGVFDPMWWIVRFRPLLMTLSRFR